MAKSRRSPGPTLDQAQTLDLVAPLLTAVVKEMRELSKKKQDGILSGLKVKSINRLLSDVQKVLGDDPSVRYLDLFEEEELPQNSDAVVVLAQWEAAVSQFRDKYQKLSAGERVWVLDDGTEYGSSRLSYH